MVNKPRAELPISERLIRHLLITQAAAEIPDVALLPLRHADEGWDCSVWRLGPDLAVRIPRRELAAPLVKHEQDHLPHIAGRLAPVGVPAPVFAGRPDVTFPWAWSVVPWFAGRPAIGVERARNSAWAADLARALRALHIPADGGFPPNPWRGIPLAARDLSIRERLAGAVRTAELSRLADLWDEGLKAAEWQGPPVWIHGDLHPGNIVVRNDRLVAMIDFGDLTAGDPAYDLAVAWLAFDERGRRMFREAMGAAYDEATWTRARAWATAVTLILLQTSDDNPAYRRLAVECLDTLVHA